jgi:hypothetical protein
MATFQNPARRLILAGGFAVAIAAAPAVAVFAVPTTSTPAPVAQCASGEVQDPATGVCMPVPAQGSVPEIQGIPAPVPTPVMHWPGRAATAANPSRISARRPLVDPGVRLGGQRFAAFGRRTTSSSRRARRSAAPVSGKMGGGVPGVLSTRPPRITVLV